MTPGEAELAERELALPREALGESSVLVDASASRGAASRLYYSVFHAARAALMAHGKHARTHSGQIALFTTTFGDARILGRLLDVRAQADYGREDLPVSPEQLQRLVVDAEAFIDRCSQIVREALARGPDQGDPPPDH